ncbi:MAG: hypothetical protein ACYC23_07205 [Limisphaerales bacterium]
MSHRDLEYTLSPECGAARACFHTLAFLSATGAICALFMAALSNPRDISPDAKVELLGWAGSGVAGCILWMGMAHVVNLLDRILSALNHHREQPPQT